MAAQINHVKLISVDDAFRNARWELEWGDNMLINKRNNVNDKN